MPTSHTAASRHTRRRTVDRIPQPAATPANETAVAVAAVQNVSTTLQDPGTRLKMIAEAAYYSAEQRGFAAGGDLDDWLRAEAEIDRRLRS